MKRVMTVAFALMIGMTLSMPAWSQNPPAKTSAPSKSEKDKADAKKKKDADKAKKKADKDAKKKKAADKK